MLQAAAKVDFLDPMVSSDSFFFFFLLKLLSAVSFQI